MKLVLAFLVFFAAFDAAGEELGCSGPDNWAASMAFVHLKNAGLTDNSKLDFDKTKIVLLASEKIGKDIYRQIHKVTFA